MYGITVTVEGRQFMVLCCPDTPVSEVLLRAAKMAKQEEEDALAETVRPYRDAMKRLQQR
jgi:hypothetical protein